VQGDETIAAVSNFKDGIAGAFRVAAGSATRARRNGCNGCNAPIGRWSQIAEPCVVKVLAGVSSKNMLAVFADTNELRLHVIGTKPASQSPIVERLAFEVGPWGFV
jgi:hypothetical protein